MQFNPDPNKQANEFYFSRKPDTDNYIPTELNVFLLSYSYYSPVQLGKSQKHFGVILARHLNFHEHIERKIKICNKLTGSIKHLFAHDLQSLLTIYKSFVSPHLDYGDIIYDNPVNESLINKLQNVQYQACLAITGAIQGTSRESLHKELGLQSLQSRRSYRRMIFFYKRLNGLTPKYLFHIIPVSNDSCYNTRVQSKLELTQFYSRTKIFNTFFSFYIKGWNKLDTKIRNLPSVSRFKKIAFHLFRN